MFNCHAPDVPNMELLQPFGSEETEGKRGSSLYSKVSSARRIAMTEPDAASSDPTNLATLIERDGDEWVINGRKWFASNGSHANCRFLIVVESLIQRVPKASDKVWSSCLLIQTACDLFETCRSFHRSPHNTHPELVLENVRVPVDAMRVG